MTVYHIVLVKLKPDTPPEKVKEFSDTAYAMVGKIPGLQKLEVGPPLAITASRGKGFNLGLVAILDKPSDVEVYAKHPAHAAVQVIREDICEDTLAYDLEY